MTRAAVGMSSQPLYIPSLLLDTYSSRHSRDCQLRPIHSHTMHGLLGVSLTSNINIRSGFPSDINVQHE